MQKISFIRALLNNVEILFLDESTSNLDDTTKDQISKILNNLDITIVNSTHNPEDFYFTTKLKLKSRKQDTISHLVFLDRQILCLLKILENY